MPWAEAKYYAANQVADEARHVEVYHRYLTEKLGISYEVHPSLQTLLDGIVSAKDWTTYLGMQIMVEGLLTPRVREAYGKLDLLKYENNKGSVEPHFLTRL